MKKIISISISFLFILFTLLLIPNIKLAKASENKATIEFKHVSFENDKIKTSVYLNTSSINVNGVTADFTYSSEILQITDLEIDDSVFDNFVESDYSQVGSLYLSCYSLDGYTGEGAIAEIIFEPISSGTATLAFTDDAVVLESNTSQDVLETPESKVYTVSEDLIALPETGTETEIITISGIVLFIALLMIAIFAIAGFTMWGGIYFSLGKWEISSEASIGGSKKGKALSKIKRKKKSVSKKKKSKSTSKKKKRKKNK